MALLQKAKWARNFLLAVVVAVLAACEKNGLELKKHEYKYLGLDSGRVITFNLAKKDVDNGHRIFAIELCDMPSFRLCLSGEITLAIPKGELKAGNTWQLAGSKFSVASIETNNKSTNYIIVAESSAGEKMKIYFNEANGIWGLQLLEDGEMYKLVDSCGLGCSQK